MRDYPATSNFRSPCLLLFLSVIGAVLLAGCSSETLFQSNFDPTPIGQPPANAQQVGTANVGGDPGSVVVVAAPVAPSGKWVQVSRAGAQSAVSGMQGMFSQFLGDGVYTASAILYIPSRSGLATVQFEAFNQPISNVGSFLHLDFMQDNTVRLDDNDATKFGSFPRDQAFIVQVTLNINATTQTAHIVLSGAGASGITDYNILPPFISMAHQFGAIRVWMGFPWTGSFDATQIVVTRQK
jgi:hypothetical protein